MCQRIEITGQMSAPKIGIGERRGERESVHNFPVVEAQEQKPTAGTNISRKTKL